MTNHWEDLLSVMYKTIDYNFQLLESSSSWFEVHCQCHSDISWGTFSKSGAKPVLGMQTWISRVKTHLIFFITILEANLDLVIRRVEVRDILR